MKAEMGLSEKEQYFLEQYIDHQEPILLNYWYGNTHVELLFETADEKEAIKQIAITYADIDLGIQCLFYRESTHRNVDYQTCMIEFPPADKLEFVNAVSTIPSLTTNHREQLLSDHSFDVEISFPIVDEEPEDYNNDIETYLYSISELDPMYILDQIVSCIEMSQLPCIAIKNDTNELTLIDMMSKKASYTDVIGINGDGKTISVNIFLLHRGDKSIESETESNTTLERYEGIKKIFDYWKIHHTTRSDDPFMSKSFCTWMQKVRLHEADYLIVKC